MEDLDHILLHQLILARKRLKLVIRMKKMMGDGDPGLNELADQVKRSVEFLESMISNKELIHKKKINKQKSENVDILARSTIQSFYRDAFIVYLYGQKMITDSFDAYMSFFRRKTDEKNKPE